MTVTAFKRGDEDVVRVEFTVGGNMYQKEYIGKGDALRTVYFECDNEGHFDPICGEGLLSMVEKAFEAQMEAEIMEEEAEEQDWINRGAMKW